MSRRRLATFAAFAALVLAPARARAGGAIDGVATRAAVSLNASSQAVLVVAAPLVTDQATPRGDELALRVASVLAGKIGGASHAHPKVASLSVARAVAGHAAGLVYVATQIEKGQLRVTVDLYPVLANGWDRARAPAPPPRAHAFADAPLDAEVRTFLPAIVLEQTALHRAHHDETNVIAAACGDLDGDGGMEIALISRSRVAVGHLRGKPGEESFAVAKKADWSTLAPRVPVPLRDPIGGASFDGGALWVATSDRGGVDLGNELAARGTLTGTPIGAGRCAKVDPASGGFASDMKSCTATTAGSAIAPPIPRADALAAADVTDAKGATRSIAAARDVDGKLTVRMGTLSRTFDDVGAQIAIGDLDLDGVPEIVTTKNATDDTIEIWTWDGKETRERKKIAAPGGVSALAICPPETNGVPALVAVVGNEVWLVR